jgi:NADPH-dependent glutamate synthase beta subunit-like oxidoreductase
VDIPAYVGRLAEGDVDGALAIIRRAHPFPAVFGRMCHFFCERGMHPLAEDAPTALSPHPSPNLGGRAGGGGNAADGARPASRIEGPALRDLERFVGDYGDPALSPVVPEKPPSGKRVAVIGGGSGGLAGAWMLRRLGHEVDVYDELLVPGGTLFTGYPPFRMAKFGVRRDDDPSSWGVRFVGGMKVTREGFEEIVGAYDLTLVTIGYHHPHYVGVPGEDAENVWNALDFILAVSLGHPPPAHRVLVLGGGGTARDASRTARRLGADVTVCYRRSRELMELGGGPFSDAEVALRIHEDEGIRFEFLVQPVRIVADGSNRAVGVEFLRTRLGPPDASGRPAVEMLPGTEFTIPCDTVVEAVGEGADLSIFPESIQTQRGRLVVDLSDHRTSHPKVFAAGEIVGLHGNDLAAHAAIQAAYTMDSVLRGEPIVLFESKPIRFPQGTGDG